MLSGRGVDRLGGANCTEFFGSATSVHFSGFNVGASGCGWGGFGGEPTGLEIPSFPLTQQQREIGVKVRIK